MEPIKKAALYTRVSTDMQVDKDSLPMQRRDLEAYADLVLGIKDVVLFEDAGFSGKDLNRPAFQDMMTRCRRGEFSHVVVWKIDRISRNLLDFITLYEELQKLHVTFVSKSEQFDTSSAMGVAMLQILLVFAQLERSMTAERVRATMISRASQGTWNGGRIPYGYRYVSDKRLTELKAAGEDVAGIEAGFYIREDEEVVVKRIFGDYIRERSVVSVLRGLTSDGIKTRQGKDWNATTVWQILKNPWYMGSYRYNRYKGTVGRVKNPEDEWVVVSDHHPAIIDNSIYEETQKIISEQSRYGEGRHAHQPWSDHLFRSVVFCQDCGGRMYGIANRTYADGETRAITYCCQGTKNGSCPNKSVQERHISDFTLSVLRNLITAKKNFSTIKDIDALTDILESTAPLRYASIDPASVAAVWDTLHRFRSDLSFQTQGGQPGRKHRVIAPEEDALKKERHRLYKAMKRAEDSYLSPDQKRPIAKERYEARINDLQGQIEEIDKRLGRLRADSTDSVSMEEVWGAMDRLLSLPEIAELKILQYNKYISALDKTSARDLLEAVVDSVTVKDGKVTAIRLLDGLSLKFTWRDKR